MAEGFYIGSEADVAALREAVALINRFRPVLEALEGGLNLDNEVLVGKLDGTLSAGTSSGVTQTVSVYAGQGSNRADSGRNITVTSYDWPEIPSGKFVIAQRINGDWYVTASQC